MVKMSAEDFGELFEAVLRKEFSIYAAKKRRQKKVQLRVEIEALLHYAVHWQNRGLN